MPASDCIFCRIVAKHITSTAVYADDEIYGFRDIAPKAPTHILVVPRKHVPTVNDLEPEDAALVGRLVLVAKEIAAKEKIEKGYRLVVNCGEGAGQTVFHLHLHLLGGRPMTWPPG